MTLTGKVLDYYKKVRVPKIRSGEAATIAIEKFLQPQLGSIPVVVLRKRDIRDLQDGMIQEGHSVGYVSRVSSVLTAALNLAVDDEEILAAPIVPEIRGDAEIEAEDLRGRELSILEVAKLIDAISDVHMLDYTIAEINTAARPEAVLELVARTDRLAAQPHRDEPAEPHPDQKIQAYHAHLGDMETVARDRHVRPDRRLPRRGGEVDQDGDAPSGQQGQSPGTRELDLVPAYFGPPYGECGEGSRTGDLGVPGHVPVAKKKSTRRYSGIDQYAPEYMSNAVAAVEAFVREVNKHTKKRDLEKPYAIKPGWKRRK